MPTGIILNGVEGKPRWESFRKGKDQDGRPYAEMQYIVDDASQADDFCAGLHGSTTLTGGVGGLVIRNAPHRFPGSNMVCLAASWAGLAEADGSTDGWPLFNGAIVDASYGIPQFDFEAPPSEAANSFPGTFYANTEDSLKPSQMVVVRPGGAFKYQTAPQLPIEAGSPIFVGRSVYERKIKGIPYLPVAVLNPLLNKINNAVVFDCAIGTLRFADFTTNRSRSDGKVVQDLTLTFEWQEYDWNKVPRRDNGKWDFAVGSDDPTYKAYAYADLTPALELATAAVIPAEGY